MKPLKDHASFDLLILVTGFVERNSLCLNIEENTGGGGKGMGGNGSELLILVQVYWTA